MYQCENNLSILVEFFSTKPTQQRLKEILLYVVNDMVDNGNYVKPFILCTAIDEPETAKVYINSDQYVELPMVTLKSFDGDKILFNIKKKIGNKEKLDEMEQLFLALIPFTKLSIPPEDVLYEVSKLTNNTTIEENTLQCLKSAQATIAHKLVPDEKQEDISKVIRMNNNIFKKHFERAEAIGEEIGLKIGEERKEKELVQKMRENGYSEVEIQKLIGH